MKSTEAISAELALIFQNVAWPNVGDAAGLQPSTVAGNLYLSLHTAAPQAGGNQSTHEAAYTGYARAAYARSSGNWTLSSPHIANAAQILFPACTAGSETELYWGIGTAPSGSGHLLRFGPITDGEFFGFTAATAGNAITIPGSSFSVDDRIAFFPLWADWPFPGGVTDGTVYWVKTVAGEVITVSASMGGSAITITSAGAGNCAKVVPFDISAGVTPGFDVGQIVILEN